MNMTRVYYVYNDIVLKNWNRAAHRFWHKKYFIYTRTNTYSNDTQITNSPTA
jgi:hypothetical protein